MTAPTQPLSLARLYQLRLTLDAAVEVTTCGDDIIDTFAEAEELLDDALLVRGMFTWADVDLLREAADTIHADYRLYKEGREVERARVNEIRNVADRIESLLPPRAS